MNTDEFEQRLKQVQLRQVPEHWREEILNTARERAGGSKTQRGQLLIHAALVAWRELIVPCRSAWTGMAALWLGLFLVNALMQPRDGNEMHTPTRLASERIHSLKEQRRILVELTGPIQLTPAEPSPRNSPKPRSERVRGIRNC